jgi:protoheme IX farnesyltransferase
MPLTATSKSMRGSIPHPPHLAKTCFFSFPSTFQDYWLLLKPRVMSLVIFTGMVGMFLAPGTLHPLKAFASMLCIALGSGAAGALNMWYERDIDGLMERTKKRPLPQQKIQPEEALGFALLLAVGSVGVMASLLNGLAAFYLALAIGFYVGVYTIWLKRRTSQNIVIGGAAGALPPVIGWASVMGETALLPWILFGIIFLWTPPHFWSLALYRQDDYKKANLPMLPLVSGVKSTKNQILLYCLALFPLSLLPVYLRELGFFYGVAAVSLNLVFLGLAVKLKFSKSMKGNIRFFLFSILYLFILFAAMILDSLWSRLEVFSL